MTDQINPWPLPLANPWAEALAMPTQQPARPAWLTEAIEHTLLAKKLPVNQDGMLMLWQGTKQDLESIKAAEMDYRKICVAFLVPDKTEGTTTVELGEGYKAKAVVKYNYKLDHDNDKVWAVLDRIAKIGNKGPFIAERLVSWTPNFLLTEYAQIEKDAKDNEPDAVAILKEIQAILTITDATPTLTINEPKAKKK